MEISPEELIGQFGIATNQAPDPRTGSNSRYTLEECIKGALSVFMIQSPSFLDFQKTMKGKTGRDNAESLFGMQAIPEEDQIRTVLDEIPPDTFFGVFQWVFTRMVQTGRIEQFQCELGYLAALDGTQTFSTNTDHIHCINCLTKTHRKTGNITYYHSVITPVLVKPGFGYVLNFPPELIMPQDGSLKQDCEINGGKRWVGTNGEQIAHIQQGVKTTILGDDLYSRQPFIKTLLGKGLSFILVCKEDSHKWLYDWVNHLEEKDGMHTLGTTEWTGKTRLVTTYRYANHVPLTDSPKTLYVNWVEIRTVNEKTGKTVHKNAFITNHVITPGNVELIVRCGRTRWKIENENNNVLKTKGYYFEHNYGHGKKYLSSVLTTPILIAFLFHTVLALYCQAYIKLLGMVGRRRLFESIRVLSQMFFVSNWTHLFEGVEYALTHRVALPVFFSSLPVGNSP